MQKKRKIAFAGYGAIIKKAAKLAIPEKETQARHIGFSKNNFFRMQIKL